MNQNVRPLSLDAARRLLPLLRERAAAADAARSLPSDVVDALRASGLMEIVNPGAHGGNHDFDAALAPIELLSRASGSAGWCFANWVQHNWMVGLWPEDAQAAYFAERPDVLCSSAFMPGGRLTPVAGGYELSGRWQYSSGSDHAEWFMLGAVLPGESLRFVLVPRRDCRVEDRWFVSGLRATGSNDVHVTGVAVPADRVIAADRFAAGEAPPSIDPQRQPGYRISQWPLISLILPFALVGIAAGALDAFEQRLRAGSSAGKPGEDAGFLGLAHAAAEVESARRLCAADLAELVDAARGDGAVSADDRLRFARNRAYVARLCLEATTRVHDAAGASVIDDDSTIGRFHRDAVAGSRHRALSWDVWGTSYGRGRAGLPVDLLQA